MHAVLQIPNLGYPPSLECHKQSLIPPTRRNRRNRVSRNGEISPPRPRVSGCFIRRGISPGAKAKSLEKWKRGNIGGRVGEEKQVYGQQGHGGAVLSRSRPRRGPRRVCDTRGNRVPSALNCRLFPVVTKLARVHGACTRARVHTWRWQ